MRTGAPPLEGMNMSEKRQHFLREYDWIRTGLMFEPRGHDLMSGSFLYPPLDPSNDAAILFIETSGCLPMCGHGTIATVTIAIQEQLITPKVEGILRLEVPAGLITAKYDLEVMDGRRKVKSVTITNVASFLYAEGLAVACPGLGELVIDVAYGGNFYAIVDVQENFPGLENFDADELVMISRELRRLFNEKYEFVHPEDSTIRGCTHILWAGKVLDPRSTARNAVFYGDRAIDRSPCGTGTSARMAQCHAKGKLRKGDRFIHESIIGSRFVGTIEDELLVGERPAIIPAIEGWAMVTGYNRIILDEDDPFYKGFSIIR